MYISRAVDADAARLMYMDDDSALFVRTGGADHLLSTRPPVTAQLHSYGAIFMVAPQANKFRGVDWRPGTLDSLGQVNSQLKGRGAWAIRSNGLSLYLRDLAARSDMLISTGAANANNDVTEAGVVAFAASREIYRYQNGTSTPLTNDPDNVHWNLYPLTDGTTTVYYKSEQGGNTQSLAGTGRIAMHHNGVETILTGQRSQPAPGQDYQVNAGWVAYVMTDLNGVWQAYTRDPGGVVRKVGPTRVLVALGPDGTVVYTSGNYLYAARAPYTGAPVRISRDWRATPEIAPTVFFRGTELMMLIGRTAFSVSY
jgi:hypothetical protein